METPPQILSPHWEVAGWMRSLVFPRLKTWPPGLVEFYLGTPSARKEVVLSEINDQRASVDSGSEL